MPIPVSTTPATPEASPRRKADHPVHSSSSPSATSVPSVAISSSDPAHEGAPATASVTARYTDTEAPPVTSTRSASPSPPGDSHITAAAPAAHSATASSSRRPKPYRVLESMASDRRNRDGPPPLANGQVRPLTLVGVDTDPDAIRFGWEAPATHTAALRGMDRVFLVPPVESVDPMPPVGPFLAEAQRLGVRRVDQVSTAVLDLTGRPPRTFAEFQQGRPLADWP